MELDGELMASGDEWVLYRASVGLWTDGGRCTGDEAQEIIQQVISRLGKEGVRVIVE